MENYSVGRWIDVFRYLVMRERSQAFVCLFKYVA